METDKPKESRFSCYCYAESEDGHNFHRPELGLIDFQGSKQNNIIITHEGSHNFSPFYDTRPGVEENARYKALGSVIHPDYKKCLGAWRSPDGVHWEKLTPEPVLTKGAFDSQNVAFWSEHEQTYVSYYRIWDECGDDPCLFKGYRTIARSVSDDFIHWSDPVMMDFGDAPREEFYTNQTQPYFRAPHLYVSLPKRFVREKRIITDAEAEQTQVAESQLKGLSDGVFMSSRGGHHFDRSFVEALVRPGLDLGNWSARSNMAGLGVVPTGPGEMSIYMIRHYAQPSVYLERLTLRTDGFASIYAPRAGGTVLTNPLLFKGGRLLLNFSTAAAGSLKVAILDEKGGALPGFSVDDADEITGDRLEGVATWRGSPDVSTLAGQPVRLQFSLTDADVFSIRFSE